ncbi:hypothetical protein BVRB_039780, partial [Beta vulgaris subsp. vulgaris]
LHPFRCADFTHSLENVLQYNEQQYYDEVDWNTEAVALSQWTNPRSESMTV